MGPLLSATIVTGDLDRSRAAYQDGLGLECLAQGRIGDQLADLWQTPDMADARWALLAANPDGIGGLRLVEPPYPVPSIKPLASLGWAAAELSVADPKQLIGPLERAGFRVLGHPRPLGSNPAIQAMQIAGPDGEVVYLADVRAYDGPMDLLRAQRPVDRLFIAVLASRDLDAARGYYEDERGAVRASDRRVAVPVLHQSLDLADDATVRISSVQLSGGCLIEHDQFPTTAPRRPTVAGLPCGIAMVSVRAEKADGSSVEAPPYHGAPVQLVRGRAGELLELVGPCP